MGHKVATRVQACLQLMRLPNIFTAIADIVAGYLMVRGFAVDWSELAGLVVATTGIYGAGCVLNDCCDLEIDRRERPHRPLPAGLVSPRAALALAIFLFAIGLVGAYAAGPLSLFLALVIVALVIVYDTVAKQHDIAGPLVMGSCRAGNLLLGMSPHLAVALPLLFPLVTFLYIALVTRVSGREISGVVGGRAGAALTGIAGIVLLGVVLAGRGDMRPAALVFLAVLVGLTLPALARAMREQTPAAVQGAVGALILALPFLDAAYAAAIQGLMAGLVVICCLIPALLVKRLFYVT